MSVRIRAGLLREQITLQSNTPTQGSNGELTDAWTTIESPYAEIEPMDGRELFGSDLKMADQPTKFRFRYSSANSGLTSRHRIVWDSKNWDLLPAKNLSGRDKLWEVVGIIRNG